LGGTEEFVRRIGHFPFIMHEGLRKRRQTEAGGEDEAGKMGRHCATYNLGISIVIEGIN
jgi:hypothetical protein